MTVGGAPYVLPEGVTALVAYRTSRGARGEYSKLSNGADACSVLENAVTAVLAPEVLIDPGLAYVSIVLMDKDLDRLSVFGFDVHVENNPAEGMVLPMMED